MARKNSRDTKGKIISAAWELFYEQGYEETTVDEIVELSGTSKGSFYHYFESKDALLGTLSYMFDKKYEELEPELGKFSSCFDKLIYLNKELFGMIEDGISLELLARLFSTQLVTKGEKHLLDRNRQYYKLLRKITQEGQDKGEFRDDITVSELVKLYAIVERGMMYEWCIRDGEYSLKKYGEENMPFMISRFLKNNF
ncbi:MAG: helix-turn-helix domain containing protein [Firmicutes bacterium]|nr:helix-turn-helix domain containing protein [Bacillota bacterium]